MSDAIIKSISYLVIILSGILLRKLNILEKDDGKTLSKISVRFTLPAALIASFSGAVFVFELILLAVFGFMINVVMYGLAYIIYAKETKEDRAIGLLNNSSYNIGSFSLPFVVGSFSPSYAIYASIFDMGNSIYSMGVNYAWVDSYLKSEKSFNLKEFIKKLFSALPFMIYLIMMTLLALNIKLPSLLFSITSMIGSSNVLIVMLMFGVLFELNVHKDDLFYAFKVLFIRYFSQTIIVLLMWQFIPLDIKVLQVLTICLYAPPTSIIPSYIFNLGLNEKSSSIISSFSVVVSILIITFLMNLWY